jgi:hypothetical protein
MPARSAIEFEALAAEIGNVSRAMATSGVSVTRIGVQPERCTPIEKQRGSLGK